MKFSQMIKVSQPELVISARHEEWLPKNGNPIYSPEALEFGAAAMKAQSTPRDRRGTVSASSLNTCVRKQQFTFLGMPELPPSSQSAQIFQNGTFMHIRWQMAGITEGWLVGAEVPVARNDLRLSGTMDGLLIDGSVAEFKSINTRGFSGISTFGAKDDHIQQVGTYMVADDHDKASILYEDKNTQEYKEIIVHRTEELEAAVRERADFVWTKIFDEDLAEPLSTCEERKGYQYTGCPFRDVCLGTKSWDHAVDTAREMRAA